MRTLATFWATVWAAVLPLGLAADGACSSGGPRPANSKQSEVRAMNDNTPSPAAAEAPAASPQLDLRASARREAGGDITVEYSVTNRGPRPVLLLNRGDTSFGLGPGRVYVEPQEDGTVNLTQRGYTLPPGHGGPGPTAAIYPGVSELAPGKTVKETVRVRAPKSRQHPYGRYYPDVPVPDPPRRVRFCLGVAPADAPTKTTRGTRVLTSLQAVAAQELLCADPQELN
ncbi:MAG TPA: hypothetical protein VF586_21590 [Pyrinomonadaceae bacterium]